MASHAGVYIIRTATTQVPLNRIPITSVEFAHERATTRDIPTETFMFDYMLNYGESLPTWIKPGTRIAVAARTNGRVLFLGRLEQPGVTPIKPGRARVRIRAVSDLNSWGEQIVNKRVNTGQALVNTPAHFKTNTATSLNAIDPTQAAPTIEFGPENIGAEYVQSGVYWSEGATMGELIKRAGNSYLQPYVGVKTGTWYSDIRTLNYTVTTGPAPLIYPTISNSLTENNVLLSGEWRMESSELVNAVDIGMFKGAVNVGDPDDGKASTIDYGFQRWIIASVNDIGTREIQVPTFWRGGQYFSGQTSEAAWTEMQKEISASQYVTEQPPPSPTVITLADVPPATIAELKAGARVTMAQNHPYKGLGNRFIEGTILSLTAKPNLTNKKSDSWTADITIAAQPNNNGSGGSDRFDRAHFRWRDYPVSWYNI